MCRHELPARFQEVLAVRRQPHLARGALEQTPAQPVFVAANPCTDGGLCRVEHLHGACEAAQLGDQGKRLHGIDVKSRHDRRVRRIVEEPKSRHDCSSLQNRYPRKALMLTSAWTTRIRSPACGRVAIDVGLIGPACNPRCIVDACRLRCLLQQHRPTGKVDGDR